MFALKALLWLAAFAIALCLLGVVLMALEVAEDDAPEPLEKELDAAFRRESGKDEEH